MESSRARIRQKVRWTGSYCISPGPMEADSEYSSIFPLIFKRLILGPRILTVIATLLLRTLVRSSPSNIMLPLSTNPESDDEYDRYNANDTFDLSHCQDSDPTQDKAYIQEAAAAIAKSPSSNTFSRSLSARQPSNVLSLRSSSSMEPSSSPRGAQQQSPEHSANRNGTTM